MKSTKFKIIGTLIVLAIIGVLYLVTRPHQEVSEGGEEVLQETQ